MICWKIRYSFLNQKPYKRLLLSLNRYCLLHYKNMRWVPPKLNNILGRKYNTLQKILLDFSCNQRSSFKNAFEVTGLRCLTKDEKKEKHTYAALNGTLPASNWYMIQPSAHKSELKQESPELSYILLVNWFSIKY